MTVSSSARAVSKEMASEASLIGVNLRSHQTGRQPAPRKSGHNGLARSHLGRIADQLSSVSGCQAVAPAEDSRRAEGLQPAGRVGDPVATRRKEPLARQMQSLA